MGIGQLIILIDLIKNKISYNMLILYLFNISMLYCLPNNEYTKEKYFDMVAQGHIEDAISYGLKLEKIYPKDDDIPASIGTLYYGLGRNEDAINAIFRALEISPKNGEYYANLGFILYKDGSCIRALPPFRKAIEYGGYSDKCILYYATGVCHYVQKEQVKGEKLISQYVSECNDPKNEVYIQDAKELLIRGKYEIDKD